MQLRFSLSACRAIPNLLKGGNSKLTSKDVSVEGFSICMKLFITSDLNLHVDTPSPLLRAAIKFPTYVGALDRSS